MSTAPSRRALVRYLHACFAWEYANAGAVELGSSRVLWQTEAPLETLASGLAPRPWLPSAAREALDAKLARHTRASSLVYALFPVRAATADGLEERPLFVVELESWRAEDARPGAAIDPVRPLVNRAALALLVDEEVRLERLADALQGTLDEGALDRARLEALCARLVAACPGLDVEGAALWPLAPATATETGEGAPRLRTAGRVLLLRRSRRSMGVLHELEAVAAGLAPSPALDALLADAAPTPARRARAAPIAAPGTLSRAQRRAVRAARRHPLSVVFGPPGTGKTHTIAMIVADTVAAGGSVLVCARNRAAADVVERMLAARLGLGGAIVRGGDPALRRELKRRLESLLQRGALRFDAPREPLRAALDAERPDAALRRSHRRARRALRRIERRCQALSSGFDRRARRGDAPWWRRGVDRLRDRLAGDDDQGALERRLDAWREAGRERDTVVPVLLQLRVQRAVRRRLARGRATLVALARSLTAHEHNQRRLQDGLDHGAMLAALPVWITTLDDLAQLFPLRRGAFELVLIDEASQVDCASALPALQRARRAVIVGDRRQLRHVSFLPGEVETAFAASHAPHALVPSFRRESLLDWADRRLGSPEAANLLDEHYRSAPPIIGFSNRSFYDEELHLLTAVTHASEGALERVRVADGRRDRRGVNRVEAEAVVARLADLLVETDPPPSVAVVSPFRAQVDHLERCIERALGASTRERLRLLVGTAHELQGEERDVVLFSATVDEAAPAGALAFLSREDVLNVAITRARHRQIVFLSREPSGGEALFARYLEWVDGGWRDAAREVLAAVPRARREAIERLRARVDAPGWQVRALVPIGRMVLDLLYERDGRRLGVDRVIDAPLGLAEHERLARIGLPVVALADDDPEIVRRALRERLAR